MKYDPLTIEEHELIQAEILDGLFISKMDNPYITLDEYCEEFEVSKAWILANRDRSDTWRMVLGWYEK